MKRKKEEEKFFYDEYMELYEKNMIEVKRELKSRLSKDGKTYLLLEGNKSIVERILCTYIKDISNDFEESIIKILNVIEKEFESDLTDSFLKEFEKINMENLNKFFILLECELEEILGIKIHETTKISLTNIKENLQINIMKKVNKKNQSMRRLIKKDKKKTGMISTTKKSIIDSVVSISIGYVIGGITTNLNEIWMFIESFFINR